MSTFIVANLGINHKGNIDELYRLIRNVADSGCNAVGVELYTTERRLQPTSEKFEIYKQCELSYVEISKIKSFTNKLGIELVGIPYDQEALEYMLDRVGIRHIQTPSLHILNPAFLNIINSYGRVLYGLHVYVPTGNTHGAKIKHASECLADVANTFILHGVPGCPTDDNKVNLSAINNIHILTNRQVGYLDYTSDNLIPTLSVLSGAKVVVKNFCNDDSDPIALNMDIMKEMVQVIRYHELIFGNSKLGEYQ